MPWRLARLRGEAGLGLVRDGGCARYSLPVFPEESEEAAASIYLAYVLLQEIIWQRSASERH